MKIGLVYGHVASNLGDLCINMGVANMINKIYPESTLHVIYRNPNEQYFEDALKSFVNKSNVEYKIIKASPEIEYKLLEEYIQNPKLFLKDTGLDNCDVILSNSGEFLFSYEYDERIDILWRVLPAFAAKVAGIKFITLPSTLGPYEGEKGRGLLKEYLRINDSYAARDLLSLDLTANLMNESKENLNLLLDPAFFIKGIEQRNNQDEPRLGVIMRLNNFGLRTGGRESTVNYRNFKKSNFKNSLAFNSTIAIIKKFIDSEKGKVDLYVQTRYDQELAEAIYGQLKEEGFDNIINIIKPNSIESYIESLSKSDFVVSSRFHGCILSFLANVPAMGIYFESHGHKMPGLYKMLEIENNTYKLTESNLDEIADTFLKLYDDRENNFRNFKANIDKLKQETLIWLKNNISNTEKQVIEDETPPILFEYLDRVKFNIMENKFEKLQEQNSELKLNVRKLENRLKNTNEQLKNTIKKMEEQENNYTKLVEQIEQIHHMLESQEQNRIDTFHEIQQMIIEQQKNNPLKNRLFNKFKKKNNDNVQNVIGSISLKYPHEKQKNLNLRVNKQKFITIDKQKLTYNLPEGEVAYITTKENFNFNIPPKNETIHLESNQKYTLSGKINYLGNQKIQLYIIEYDHAQKIKTHKCKLNSGSFEIEFNTNSNINNLCIAFRITGKGNINLNFGQWQLVK